MIDYGWHVLPNGKYIHYVQTESFEDSKDFLGKLVLIARDKPLDTQGFCMLEYGETGAGKTMSASTLEDGILFVVKEAKDPRMVHNAKACDKPDIPIKSIFYDGLTTGQYNYKQDIEDSRYDARVSDPKEKDRGLIDRFRFERPDWGAMASMMSREVKLLTEISKTGRVVIATAIDSEYPKWNNSLKIAPAFQGLEFPKLVHGFFDFIGYIIKPYRIEDGKEQVPRISFVSSPDTMGNSYMARSSSSKLVQAELNKGPIPLNFELITKLIRG